LHLPPTEHLPDVAGSSPNTSAQVNSRPERHEVRFEDEIDLGQYLRPLRQHWMMIAAACVLGALAGLLVSARRPTLYEASTTVLVQQATTGEAVATARALLRNYTLAAETLKEVGLADPPYAMTPQSFINDALVVEESGGTHLLNVKVRLAVPALAARASSLLASKAVQLNRQVATEGNRAVRDQLKVLLDDASHRLDAAEQELLAERSRSRLEVGRKDAELMLDGRGELQQIAAQIASEKGRLNAAEEELKRHQPLLAAPRLPSAEEALRQADLSQSKLDDSRRAPETPSRGSERPRGGDEQPRKVEGASRDAATPPPARRPDPGEFEALPDLSNPYVNPVYQTLQFQIAMSRARVAGLEREQREIAAASRAGEIGQLYRNELLVARLENNYELAKRVYSDLAVRYEQSRVESVGNMVQLQIVDPATPPDRPMPRKRAESGLLGLAAAFFLASIVAIFVMPTAPEATSPRRRS
jgi:hypothetical protein